MTETEPNNLLSESDLVRLNEPFSGSLVEGGNNSFGGWAEDKNDVYRIDVPEAGILSINLAGELDNAELLISLSDYAGSGAWVLENGWASSSLSSRKKSINAKVEEGTYYLNIYAISRLYENTTVRYTLELTHQGFQNSAENEPNDTAALADALHLEQVMVAGLASSEDKDWYRFVASEPTVFELAFEPPTDNESVYILSIFNEEDDRLYNLRTEGSESIVFSTKTSGDYFLRVTGEYGDVYQDRWLGFEDGVGPQESYAVNLSRSYGSLEAEPNDTMGEANRLSVNIPVRGQASGLNNNDADYFSFMIPRDKAGMYHFKVDSVDGTLPQGQWDINLYNAAGGRVDSFYSRENFDSQIRYLYGNPTISYGESKTATLTGGAYFLKLGSGGPMTDYVLTVYPTESSLTSTNKPSDYKVEVLTPIVEEGGTARFKIYLLNGNMYWLFNDGAKFGPPFSLAGITLGDIDTTLLKIPLSSQEDGTLLGLVGGPINEADRSWELDIPIVRDTSLEGGKVFTLSIFDSVQGSVSILDPTDPVSSPQLNTYSLDVIVDLFGQVLYLKGLTETVSSTAHTIEYEGTSFNYSDVDGLLTTVVRDGEFTEEFAKEIADAYPSVAGINYSTAVALVGASAIEDVLIAVAGADGNYVG